MTETNYCFFLLSVPIRNGDMNSFTEKLVMSQFQNGDAFIQRQRDHSIMLQCKVGSVTIKLYHVNKCDNKN